MGPRILLIIACITILFVLMELDGLLWQSSTHAEGSWIHGVFSLLQEVIIETFQLLWRVLKFFVSILEEVLETIVGDYSSQEKVLYKLYKRAERSSGLPWQIFWGLHMEESSIGKNLGRYKVMEVLAEDQQPYFLEICKELDWDPYEIYGSKAGALGPFQILPETWVRYAIDGNEDGRKDPFTPEDAILTAARYLVAKGGQENLKKALWHYNPDHNYVQRVLSYVEKN